MKTVILESPYGNSDPIEVEKNLIYARLALEDCLMNFDEAPFASHLLYTQVLDDQNPRQRKMGIEAGLEWGLYAYAAVFYVDRGWSEGMRQAELRHRKDQTRIITRELPVYLQVRYQRKLKELLA